MARIDGDEVVGIDVNSDGEDSEPMVISGRNGTTYFWTGNHPALWRTDGTQMGTVKVADLLGATEGVDQYVHVMAPVADGVVLLHVEDGHCKTSARTSRLITSRR